ncbi:MAG: fibronectin type III domain-containing protein [Oscillospiraceae bacterium]|nr:fibronectin type III domain-containing protein [Oscillospiraceae bacterium]
MKKKRFSQVLVLILTVALLSGVAMPIAGASTTLAFLNPFGFDATNMPDNQPLTERSGNVGNGEILQLRFDRPNDAHIIGSIASNLIANHDPSGTDSFTIPVNTAGPRSGADFDNWANNAAVVIGVVDDNMAALWASYYAREIEARGTPVVVIVNEMFEPALRNGALKNGFTEMRVVVIDAMLYSRSFSRAVGSERDDWIDTHILGGTGGVLARANDALTTTLASGEHFPPIITPAMMAVDIPGSVSGNSLAAAGRNFLRMANQHNFGDGLPLVIPTSELVNAMIAQSGGRAGNEVLGMMVGGGIVTVENVAVNAVMAGAAPEYFPIILAAMEAIANSREYAGFDIDRALRNSLGNMTVSLIVSGPISHELGMINDRSVEDGILGGGPLGNTLSANVSIGRAISLSYRNIGLNRPEDTARRGSMIRLQEFNVPVIAETLRYLPSGWVSHSEFMGFGAGANTVSLVITSQARLATGSGAGVGTGTQDPLPGAVITQAAEGRAVGAVAIVALAGPGADVLSRPSGTDNTNPNYTPVGAGTSSVRNMDTKALMQNHLVGGNVAQASLVWPIIVGGCAAPNQVFSVGGSDWGSGFHAQLIGATQVSSAPQNFAVLVNGADAELSWEAPARAVGTIIYEVSADGGRTWTDVGDTLTHTFSSLPGGNYTFVVRAVNSDAANSVEIADVAGTATVDFDSRSGRGAWAIVHAGVQGLMLDIFDQMYQQLRMLVDAIEEDIINDELAEEDYTAESWSALQAVLEVSRNVLANENANLFAILEAYENLRQALADLVYINGDDDDYIDEERKYADEDDYVDDDYADEERDDIDDDDCYASEDNDYLNGDNGYTNGASNGGNGYIHVGVESE